MGTQNKHWMDFVFALVLFSVFAATVLMTTITGAASYKNTVQSQKQRFEQNTSLTYIASKIRNSDQVGSISLEPFGGETALVIKELYHDTTYLTRIYYHNGSICELFSEEGLDVGDAGLSILPATGLDFTLHDDLLTIIVTGQDGQKSSLSLCLRSETGGLLV